MSLFHDDPFDLDGQHEETADEVAPSANTELDSALEPAAQASAVEVDEALDEVEQTRTRKRSRSGSEPESTTDGVYPLQGGALHDVENEVKNDVEAPTSEGRNDVEAPSSVAPTAPDDINSLEALDAQGLDVLQPAEDFVHQEREKCASVLFEKVIKLEQQLKASCMHQESLQRASDDARDNLQRRVAELTAENDHLRSSSTGPSRGCTEALQCNAAAVTESRLSLSIAERESREHSFWQHRAEFLENALRWQQRSADLWKEAFTCAQSRPASDSLLGGEITLDNDPFPSAVQSSKDIGENMLAAHAWLEALPTEPTEAEGETPRILVAPAKRSLLAKLILMAKDHLGDVAQAHDKIAQIAEHHRHALQRLTQTVNAIGLKDLEPRIALLREMIDRQMTAAFVAPEETELRKQLKDLQDRNALLEAVVASHVAKIDHIPNAQAVVPHVLKERIARCEALEKEVCELRNEVLFLQRLRGADGTSSLPDVDSAPPEVANAPSRGKEELLEALAQQWLERAREATSLYLQDCDNGNCLRSAAYLELQLQHALSTGQTQLALIQRLESDNTCLRAQLDACTYIAELAQSASPLLAVHDNVGDWANCVKSAVEEIQTRVSYANGNAADNVAFAELFSKARADMDASLLASGEKMRQALWDGQGRYRLLVGFLSSALNRADAALCASLGLQHSPLPELPVDAIEPQQVSFAICPLSTPTASAEVQRAVQALGATHKEHLAKLTMSYEEQLKFHTKRWDWVLSQQGADVLKELSSTQGALQEARTSLAACEARCQEASLESAKVPSLQSRLTDREARVSSLESQLRISQEALSKSRHELVSLQKERSATAAEVEARVASFQTQIQDLEAELQLEREARANANEAMHPQLVETDPEADDGGPEDAAYAEEEDNVMDANAADEATDDAVLLSEWTDAPEDAVVATTMDGANEEAEDAGEVDGLGVQRMDDEGVETGHEASSAELPASLPANEES